MNLSYELIKHVTVKEIAVSAISTAKDINDTIHVIVDYRVGICPFNVNCWFSLSRHKKVNPKLLSEKTQEYYSYIIVIRQNVPHKFTEHSMETPCWCPCSWAPTWRSEINENIWNSLLL